MQTLWKGDASVAGSLFRSIAITSDEFNSTQGTFQILAEGLGKGVHDGKFAGSDTEGFKRITFMDMIDFEEKLRASRK
jgi:hypothetical protein